MILIKISYIQKQRNEHVRLLHPFYPVLRYKQFLFIKNTKKSQFAGYTTRYSFYRLQYVTYIIRKDTICKQTKIE